ncbi:MAG TPA: hypothetical protein DCZ92_02525 [Elusimicrobia bacterium]|nr:MAG: hypothetical protein A2016_11185 [Elusimicrobia bacterium GWF2_62_30]HBA59699.1 hypothetical protein [Elusimicrobiota bacterium]
MSEETTPPPLSGRHLAVLIFFECAAVLALAEGFLAWTGVDTRLLGSLLYFQGADVEAHRVSNSVSLHYELAPGTHVVFAGGRGVTVNQLGFRDPPRSAAKPAGVKRVICLGSSNTYGALVGDGLTWPAQLEKLLNSKGPGKFEAWDAGVSAYVIPQNLEQARRFLKDYSPDLLLFQFNNRGRRTFLLGQPFMGFFDKDPELYYENLRYCWPRPLALLRHWRLARTLVFYANSRSLKKKDPAYDWNKCDELAPADIAAFRKFYEENKGRVKMAILETPVPGNKLLGAFDGLGLPVIRLAAKLPPKHDPEFDKIHPAAYVYAWYAKEIAAELPRLGL